ncbi:YibE/F family protein [Candidatus Woesebacteria bacterium]|nr:MAG: YibE/F family protein [Candidatus Woesebacteria bacterium]
MKVLQVFSFFFFLAVFIFSPGIKAQGYPGEEIYEGRIINVENETKTDPLGEDYLYQQLIVDITRGVKKGQSLEIVNDTISIEAARQYFKGDEIVIMHTVTVDNEDLYYITDYVRRGGLKTIFAVFVFMTILVGGIWGASSIVGMVFSFLIIFKFVLPFIISGHNAIVVSVIGSSMIIPVTFSLSHGFKTKTWIASIGTIISLVFTGILALVAVKITHLSGFGSEEASFVSYQLGDKINMQGLLLAGIIISSLGVLDDITISQASIVAELKSTNKKLKFAELFTRAMNVGRDHIASLVNTLVLVYAGASLPLLILFVNHTSTFSDVINIEMIVEEVVRTLVGSMGLILAVPITTLIAAYKYRNK